MTSSHGEDGFQGSEIIRMRRIEEVGRRECPENLKNSKQKNEVKRRIIGRRSFVGPEFLRARTVSFT